MATLIADGYTTFICTAKPEAKKVFLAGSFNDWDPTAKPMKKNKDGSFRARLELEAGEYQYKFVVDGQWLADPDASQQVPDSHGGSNSVVCVG